VTCRFQVPGILKIISSSFFPRGHSSDFNRYRHNSRGRNTGPPADLEPFGSDFRIEGPPEPEAGKEMIINIAQRQSGYFGTLVLA